MPYRLRSPLFSSLIGALIVARSARAFDGKFSLASPPSQCGNFTATWQGGTPPFELLLVPVGHVTPEVRTIVDDNISSGSSTSFTLKFPTGSQFVAVLSDATGVGSGGTSDILTVGDGPSDCLTGPVEPKFFLYLDTSTANQCASVSVGWDSSAAAPVSLWGIIPAGDSFSLNPPSSGTSFDWTANVKAGTKMMVVAGDKNGRGTGGSTDIWTVGGGSDGCISGNSPSTTNGPPAGQVLAVEPTGSPSASGSSGAAPTGSGVGQSSTAPGASDSSSPSGSAGPNGTPLSGGTGNADGASPTSGGDPPGSTQDDPTTTSSSGSSTGRIAAIVVGVLGGILLLFLLSLYMWRARRRRRFAGAGGPFTDMRAQGDLLASRPPSLISGATGVSIANRAPHENVPRQYATEPFILPGLHRSHSGYSADVSDAGSTSEVHTMGSDERRRLFVPSPIMTPTDEEGAFTLEGEKPSFAPVTPRTLLAVPQPTHSPAPPSFATVATGGHTRSQRSRRSGHNRAFLHPEAEASTGTVDAPPVYDSWKGGPLVAVNATPRDEKANPFAG